ncbi:NADH-quinone oxidoreductase subunit L [Pontibacter sp. G13]|uniref:NADH-quinone oxidoreductase subunit 5 family protein n=1 Tax=Pontibacter sp. G13 TaxID=3074898 RepID=UPI0028891398|nr:NADH-quinone oxidoreductase subunit L [Pontibacter sp. G13]WNJ16269.1 NADH-quinone oxidoreductase subunit L [Pontibacter sp. G13]
MKNLDLLHESIPPGSWEWVALAIWLTPLILFLSQLIVGNKLPRKGSLWSVSLMGVAFALALFLFFGMEDGASLHARWNWITLSGGSSIPMYLTLGIQADSWARLMLVLVTGVAWLVLIYSVSYMKGDPELARYWAYLGLFCFAMLGIVLADGLVMLFVNWELVGVSSYLLIGYYRHTAEAASASQQAFLVNRIGDAGLLAGMCILLAQLGTLDFSAMWSMIEHSQFTDGNWQTSILLEDGSSILRTLNIQWVTWAGILLACGAIAKSAQFPLQLWLPDAMAGPTPVSSLLHAATMVAAGVFLLGRISPLLTEQAGALLAIVGAITALMAAIAALTQWDIKRVLAFSTISQLGYMVIGIGVGATDMALFHLVTHAFFKCALFLNAGAVIHALHQAFGHHGPNAQDMRNMGGLKEFLPRTFGVYLPAMLALAGIPLFSGFLSKDGILLGAVHWAQAGVWLRWLVPIAGFLTAGLTAFYMARHAWLIFGGSFRANDHIKDPIHRTDAWMLIPMILLAIASVGFCFSLNPWDGSHSWVLDTISNPGILPQSLGIPSNASHDGHHLVGLISVFLAVAGMGTFWLVSRSKVLVEKTSVWTALSFHHFYQSQLYDWLIIKPVLTISQMLAWFDRVWIDGAVNGLGILVAGERRKDPSLSALAARFDEWGVDGLVRRVIGFFGGIGRAVSKFQLGQFQKYLLALLLGLGALIFLLISIYT